MVTGLIAALIGTASIAPASAIAAPPRPAIWVVNDEDTVIYLFGTFHALKGQPQWFNSEVQTAFAHSNELMLETLVPTPADFARGLPGSRLPPGEANASSFLASTRIAINAGRSQGLQVDQGADMVLREVAEASGKPVGGLEPFEDQLNMIASIPASPDAAKHARDPAQIAALAAAMGAMESAWKRGDERVFAAMLDQMRRSSPQTYRIMFDQRNGNWAQWIAGRLSRPGTVFVAVGAGHLAGPDSVQAKLASFGVRSARIN